MKKCPKCGTVLDDSKKKCYMCGADLQRASLTFGDSFDSTIGATVTKSQGSALNPNTQPQKAQPQPNPMAGINQEINRVGGNVQNTNGFESEVFRNQRNGMMPNTYDDRSAIAKMFSSDPRFGNRSEINAQEAMMNNPNSFQNGMQRPMSNKEAIRKLQDAGNTQNPTVPRGTPQANPYANNLNSGMPNPNNAYNTGATNPFANNGGRAHQPTTVRYVQQGANRVPQQRKPSINWGNNLIPNNGNKVNNYQDKTSKFKINFSFIFNTTCFVIFVILFIFVYFKYLRVDNKNNVADFGGLSYQIGKEFTLKNNEKHERLYSYGDNCSVRIQYGPTNDGDYYIEEKFNEVKEMYSKDDYQILSQEIRINSNVWSGLKILEFKEDATGTGGFSQTEKFKFILIVYKGNYYNITYSNLTNDNACSAGYNSFEATLSFVEDKKE